MGSSGRREPVVSVKDYGARGDGSTNDTTACTAAIAALTAGSALVVPPGTYMVDGLLIQSLTNFRVIGHGGILKLNRARTGSPLVNTANVLTIADCSGFSIDGLIIDGNRNTAVNLPVSDHAPVSQYLQSNASSGQANVTVSDGTKFVIGERVWVCGGLTANGAAEKDFVDNAAGVGLTINAIAGNVLTLSANLTHTYTATGAAGGAYVTTYQTGNNASVAGRTLGSENQQNGIHLLTCSRFSIANCRIHDVWESPIKVGTGLSASALTDTCSYGAITGNVLSNGYDQGISIWTSDHIAVTGNTVEEPGWACVSMTGAYDCTITGNVLNNANYVAPGDTASGSGVACEGGARHVISGNHISACLSKGLNLAQSPMFNGSSTLGATIAAGATGSILVASSAFAQVGAPYSIYDGARSEQVIVTSIPDGTHISIGTAKTRYWHPSGVSIGTAVPEDITFADNIINGVPSGVGVQVDSCVRVAIRGNLFKGVANQCINGHSADGSPSGYGAALRIVGNIFTSNQPGGGSEVILIDSIGEVTIRDNDISGFTSSGTIGIHLKAATDALVQGNRIRDMSSAGIFVEGATKRTTIAGNHVTRCSNEGIILVGGSGLSIIGNVATSNNAVGINPRGVDHCIVKGNISTANNGTGIKLEDNGGTGCSYCVVEGNLVRDDSSGSYQGSALTQGNSIVEAGASNNNRFLNNQVDHATTVVGGSSSTSGELVN